RCPTIVVHDDNGDSVVLQELFKRELQEQATNKTVKIKDVKFLIHHLRLARTADQTHRLHICACRRVVVSVPLAGKIPDLTKSLTDDKGQPFVYVGYLTGEHLDTSVNPERTAFDIEQSAPDSPLYPNQIYMDDLIEGGVKAAEGFLSKWTAPIGQRKQQKIQTYVANAAPQYRAILRKKPDEIAKMPPNATDQEMDVFLHRIKLRHEADLKEEGSRIIDQA